MEGCSLGTNDADLFRIAKASSRFDQRIEHGLQIEGRAADDLEHISRGCLLLEGLGEIIGALPEFIEQPRVLDRDNCLRRKIRQQLDLLVAARPPLLTMDDDDSDNFFVLKHRYGDNGPNVTKLYRLDCRRMTFDIGWRACEVYMHGSLRSERLAERAVR